MDCHLLGGISIHHPATPDASKYFLEIFKGIVPQDFLCIRYHMLDSNGVWYSIFLFEGYKQNLRLEKWSQMAARQGHRMTVPWDLQCTHWRRHSRSLPMSHVALPFHVPEDNILYHFFSLMFRWFYRPLQQKLTVPHTPHECPKYEISAIDKSCGTIPEGTSTGINIFAIREHWFLIFVTNLVPPGPM